MFERLVYVSRAAPGVGARDAYDIVRTAHNRNSQLGLTGALVFVDGHFVQVLEGDAFHLRQRFAVIAADPRHTDVQVREHVAIDERLFPDEWMALRHGDEVPETMRREFVDAAGAAPHHWSAERLLAYVRAACAGAAAPR
ncbi:BLUF domain-containing protein [Azohydromonas sediminis]|uniref:BLUF domain-containing protein n=1 Tax=Azohydromonas sediminis TaxID=2259674 RepID=UPI000E64774F|nr:BLUF domain-containing protein [Azohydromonas sediminis]